MGSQPIFKSITNFEKYYYWLKEVSKYIFCQALASAESSLTIHFTHPPQESTNTSNLNISKMASMEDNLNERRPEWKTT